MAAPVEQPKYISLTRQLLNIDDIDPITLEEINLDENKHPKYYITISTGLRTKPVIYKTEAIWSYIQNCINNGITPKNPLTRQNITTNDIKRIKHYIECLEKYPEWKRDELNEIEIITNYINEPDNELKKDKFRFLVSEDGLMDYYRSLGHVCDSREEGIALLSAGKSWIIRKSSVPDTEYCFHFVIQKEGKNFLFQHRLGYGIIAVTGPSGGTLEELTYHNDIYYETGGEFWIANYLI